MRPLRRALNPMSTDAPITSSPNLGRRFRFGDIGLRALTAAAALLAILTVGLLVWEVLHGAKESISTFGLGFITSTD